MGRNKGLWKAAVLCLPIVLLCACSDKGETPNGDASQAEPARVSVIRVKPEPLTVYEELPGRVSAYRSAEIRAQVGGIIQKKIFREGTLVDKDAPLFQIDPAPFAADVDAAAAVLTRVEAEFVNAQIKFNRAELLSSKNAMSTESLNDATAALAQAKANVAEARANLAKRRLELSNATIRSPISGFIGQSFMSEGGLASPSATSPLAVVQQIDQVFVDVRQSAMSLEDLRNTASEAGVSNPQALAVKIMTLTGKPFSQDGKLLFSDITVDSATSSLGLRILVANPQGQLLPGMFIRAMVPRAVYSAALLVPQEAIARDSAGRPQLMIVGADGTGTARTVTLGEVVAGRYLVRSGLAAGEVVVVLGKERVQPGQHLETPPYLAAVSGKQG
ncbi:efflux RND transporter periplasmic adaptor subunit [Allorhizobium sp. BGMRC 0089]|uniref:efflux RND transporter periplasmic adaptor subunit n=1 Tax=Allorhizobium sonneratiae TaxID=2934936 RepID=UPI0020341278|nr:efflux RND transporter periplasmic adaptor subunit [Allorhizobium sonneratiae]MCM2292500.1 efflux RND transporter periplasmic adaptor subunit [Allorhizobium sonneratiae]